MKRQKKQLVILIILLAVCVLGYVLLNIYQEKKEEKEAEENAAETIFTTDTEKITQFSYMADGVTYHYEKSEDGWTCEEEPDLKLDETQILALLSNLAEISCDEVLSDVEDYDTYGFNDPSNVIEFRTEDGEQYSITIGDYNQTAYCYYYMTNLSENVYVGNAYVCSAFMQTPDYYQVIETEEAVSDNTTDNTIDNATDNMTDNTADNAIDNATDNMTDNTTDNTTE